jgi:hypothetical protein
MRFLINLFVLAALLLTQFSCTRKGDGDPLVSLQTRKARLDGNWKITVGSGVSSLYSSATGTMTNKSWVYSNGWQIFDSPDVWSREYSIEIDFKKEGTYKWVHVEKSLFNGTFSTTTETGRWNFKAGKDESKRKEEIILQTETYSPGDNPYIGPFNLYDVKVYELHTLRKDKIIMKRSYDPFYYGVPPASGLVNTEEWTLEPR